MLRAFFICLMALLGSGALGQTESPQSFIADARQALERQILAQSSDWHLGSEQDWRVDFQEGTIVFKMGKTVTARARIQVIGSYHKVEKTFVWGWDHPLATESLRNHSQLVRTWGQKAGLEAYTTRKVPCTEEQAWDMAALAHKLAGSQAVFRGPSGVAFLFLTLSDIKVIE
jgi:hypothetical protein